MTHPILITGASRGLGAAFAEALAGPAPIIAVARTTGALEELDDRIKAWGGTATLAPMDVTNAPAMRHLATSILDRWGGVSLWIHTAVHAPPLMPAGQMSEKDWDASMALNARATAALIPTIGPLLGRTGHAVFFSDDHLGEKFFGAYAASKAAHDAMVRAWAAETKTIGPKVHLVHPAPMATAVRARFFPGENREGLAQPMDEARRILADLNLR